MHMCACVNLSLLQGVYIWVAKDAPQALVQKIFGVQHFGAIPEVMVSSCTSIVRFCLVKLLTLGVCTRVTVVSLCVCCSGSCCLTHLQVSTLRICMTY